MVKVMMENYVEGLEECSQGVEEKAIGLKSFVMTFALNG